MMDDYPLDLLPAPLLKWFADHARILPWRENPKPYYVWISEIMLQQTRVEAVKPYFERFIDQLPDVRALAQCEDDRLLKLWEGLGYYNRVRNLKVAANQVMERYGGSLPEKKEQLLELKGIGSYTAGAIASIAYNHPVPAVDGNVLRVISRVTADPSDIAKPTVRKHMEEKLEELMKSRMAGENHPFEKNKNTSIVFRPSSFNQALMELGAMVCVPNGEPHCLECPWGTICLAKQYNRIPEIPVKKKQAARKIEELTILVIRDADRVAIRKRASTGLLAGLYELPNQKGHLDEEQVISYLKQAGYSPIHIKALGNAKHIFSHVEWNMIGYAVLIEEPGEELIRKEKKEPFLFIDAKCAQETYAIPTAFAYYTRYMNIQPGYFGKLKKN